MKNQFLKHFLVIGSGTFISMLLGFLTTPVITRIVAPTEYGQYSIFTMYSNMALMVLYLGLDQSFVRYFYDKETEGYRRGLLFKCLKYPIRGTIAAAVIIIFSAIWGVFQFELGFSTLVLVCLYAFLQIIYRFSLLLVRLQYKSKLYSMLGIIQKAVYVCLALLLVYSGIFNDVTSLAISTIMAVFVCVLLSIYVERNIWNPTKLKEEKCLVSQKELITYAYPYVFSMGATTLFQYIDKISLNIYRSYEDIGIYSSTMTLVHVFSIIQTTFNTLWAPMAIEHYTKDQKDVSFYQKGNQLITAIMFFIGLSLILFKDIFVILLGEKYREAAYILPFLIFNPIMYTISETTVSGLVFKKKSGMQIVVAAGACIVNIIGNTLLVPKYGCQGAAISTGVSYIVLWALRTYLSNRYFYVDFHLKKFYMITILTVLYAFYNTFIKFNIWSIIGYAICIIFLVVLYFDCVKLGIKFFEKRAQGLIRRK